MSEIREVTDGLRFPEGPIAMPDGSVIVVEIRGQALTRVNPDGSKDVIAELGGGPNGAAMGPDGKCYVCNNGGFQWVERNGLVFPGNQAEDYVTGRIERVDVESGASEVLYDACDGEPLKGPNDIVFDATGGFWFTDLGKTRPRDRDRTGIFYAKPDGSSIEEKVFPLETPNGIGLSPDEDRVYVAETSTCRLWAFELKGPGEIDTEKGTHGPGRSLVADLPIGQSFDSLAVDVAGNICVATLGNGGVTVISPDGKNIHHVPMPDVMTTNICFGGDDLGTAFLTLSSTGKLVATEWETPGLALNFLNE